MQETGSAERNGASALAKADEVVRAVLVAILGLDAKRAAAFDADTELFGALPEFDSMAVAGLLTELEERLDIYIEDDEVDGDLFATFGALVDFTGSKLTQ